MVPIRENLTERGWGHALLDLDDDGLAPAIGEQVDPLLRVQSGLLLNRRRMVRVRWFTLSDAFTENQSVELLQVFEEIFADDSRLAVRALGIRLANQEQPEVAAIEDVVTLGHELPSRERAP